MVYEKVLHANQKKVDVAQKSVSCRQKQDDTASKKYFVRKKVITFFRNDAPYTISGKRMQESKICSKYARNQQKIMLILVIMQCY